MSSTKVKVELYRKEFNALHGSLGAFLNRHSFMLKHGHSKHVEDLQAYVLARLFKRLNNRQFPDDKETLSITMEQVEVDAIYDVTEMLPNHASPTEGKFLARIEIGQKPQTLIEK